jgi:hypothetical protein
LCRHPRISSQLAKAGMAGTSPAMTSQPMKRKH